MEKGTFLSNIINPKNPNARMHFHHSDKAFFDEKLADLEWKNHLVWVNRNTIGRPQATKKYTVEQLEIKGYVGVYLN